jgi:thioredoxin reductase (NADPH)
MSDILPGAESGEFPTDPYDRPAQIYPRLSPEMIARAGAYGIEGAVDEGTFLFRRGQRTADFFIVIDGAIEVLEQDEHDAFKTVTVHFPSEFTGELDLLNNRATLVAARVKESGRLIRVDRASFRRLIAAEPDIGEIVLRALILRRMGFIQHAQAGVVLVGSRRAGDTLRLRRFLTRNGYPHRLVDIDAEPEAYKLLCAVGLVASDLPVVFAPGIVGALSNPTTAAFSDALGLTEDGDASEVHDVAVVGAGPAGLAAAVYAASEGLGTIVIEGLAPGGQAGTSSKIENYLGFPTGISGQSLAGRAQVQAQKFGAQLLISRMAMGVECAAHPFDIVLDDGRHVLARSVVIATGARYRKLDVPDYERFEGQGIHYAATPMEAQLCDEQEVMVVGGGNSAGQAAVFLSKSVRHVHLLVRSGGLAQTMSDYLVQRIDLSPKITLHTRSEITALEGDRYLSRVTWTDRDSGVATTRDIGNVFVMIGADPNTEWLGGCVKVDDKGFVCTGTEAETADGGSHASSPFETTHPGVFAVGDVRANSVKRVASGVGEGSVVVQAIHRFLAAAEA